MPCQHRDSISRLRCLQVLREQREPDGVRAKRRIDQNTNADAGDAEFRPVSRFQMITN